jgi:HSP20 family protein
LASGRRVPHGVALDAWRSGSAYQVALDLPGVDPERIELICERNGLSIRAERAADLRRAGRSAHRRAAGG